MAAPAALKQPASLEVLSFVLPTLGMGNNYPKIIWFLNVVQYGASIYCLLPVESARANYILFTIGLGLPATHPKLHL